MQSGVFCFSADSVQIGKNSFLLSHFSFYRFRLILGNSSLFFHKMKRFKSRASFYAGFPSSFGKVQDNCQKLWEWSEQPIFCRFHTKEENCDYFFEKRFGKISVIPPKVLLFKAFSPKFFPFSSIF